MPSGPNTSCPPRSHGPTARPTRPPPHRVKARCGGGRGPRSHAMRYIGLDLHKQSLEVCALDRKGKRLFRQSVACDRKALGEFARKHLRETDRLAVEATTNTWAVVEILRPFVAQVVVGNPLQIKVIAQ